MKNPKNWISINLILILSWLIIPKVSAQECFDEQIVTEQYTQQTSFATGVATQLSRPGSSLRTNVMIGFTFMGETDGASQGAVLGPFAFGSIEPKPVNTLTASEGDYPDQIVINWSEEFTGAKVDQFKLYRNGSLLAEFPNSTLEYTDQNVIAGRFYQYSVVASNSKGDSPQRSVIGFVNPNGTVTGRITTARNRAVIGSDVVLTPTLGKSLVFDGSNDAIKFEQHPKFNTSVYTVEAWVRPNGTPTESAPILIKESTDVNSRGFALFMKSNRRAVEASFSDGQSIISIETRSELEDLKWSHIAFVNTGSVIQLFVNGRLEVERVISSSAVVTSAPVFVGAVPGKYGKFRGFIDDVRIWNIDRTQLELQAFQNRTLNSNDEANGLVAYWKFDEGTGDKVFDATSNSIDGLICGAQYHADIPNIKNTATSDKDGNYVLSGINYGSGQTFTVSPFKQTQTGRSVTFDGVDDYAEFSSLPELNASFTIETWVRRQVENRDQIIVGMGSSQQAGTSLQLGFNSENKLYFSFSNADLVSPEAVNDLWHHVAVTYNHETNEWVLFLDGQRVASDNSGTNLSINGTAVLGRSSFSSSMHYMGRLDEFRIWSDIRSLSEIQEFQNDVLGPIREDLIVYLQFNEGSKLFGNDATGLGHGVDFMNTTEENLWNTDIPFAEDFIHVFDPESRKITLNNSSTSVDGINFQDISLISVSGYVRYEGTDCFADSVEILVNGEALAPKVFTDKSGKFVLELEPGTTARLSAKYKSHSFAPATYEVVNITQPIANVVLENMEKRTLTGVVGGGDCLLPIGIAEVTIRSLNGCFERKVMTDDTGRFTADNLPPLNMAVLVNHPNPNITNALDGKEVNLVEEDGHIDFIYYSDPELNLSFVNAENKGGKDVLSQLELVSVMIQLQEPYINGTDTAYCAVDSAVVSIKNNMADGEEKQLTLKNGQVIYTFRAGKPNILVDYTLGMFVSAKDSRERTTVNNDLRAIVQGIRPRETTFTTKTPDIPFLILHDPAGDKSYSFFEEGSSYSTNLSFEVDKGVDKTSYLNVSMGADITTEAGIGFSVETEVDITADLNSSVSTKRSARNLTEQTLTFTSKERISTSSSDAFVGDEGDVYMGGAFNLVYGVSDVLKVDDEGTVSIEQDIIIVPEAFATTFIYSESFINNTLIPSLYLIGDTTSATTWEQYVAKNQETKAKAGFLRNISFDAGSVYEYSETIEQSNSVTVETALDIETEAAVEAGLAINGVGFVAGSSVKYRITVGSSTTTNETSSKTFGFVLEDDDEGDFFSVDVKADSTYGSPVFKTVSGSSSNPWQVGTAHRDIPQLTVNSVKNVDVAPTETAVFDAIIGNGNLDQSREYKLSVVQETNPDGATVFVNGVPVEDGIRFFMGRGDSRKLTVTAAKGPVAYTYENILLKFQAANDTSVYVTSDIDFSFYKPCSEIKIAEPSEGFILNDASNDTVSVTLYDYNTESANIRDVKVQYRRSISVLKSGVYKGVPDEIQANEWITVATLTPDKLQSQFTIVKWATTELVDGKYQIRAILTCSDDPIANSSGIITGIIDRSAPIVNGLPSPGDGVLGPNDAIQVTFNEFIDASRINPVEDVILTFVDTGKPIDIVTTVFENGISIVPQIEDQFLENRLLRATVNSIYDEVGNGISQPIVWEMLYNKSPIRWEDPLLQSFSYLNEDTELIAEFVNNGSSPITFNLTEIPSWIQVNPVTATVDAGSSEEIRVTVLPLGAGTYEGVLYAIAGQVSKPLTIRHRVMCESPPWIVNEGAFQHSMSIIGELYIDEELSKDVFDRVAAYINGELRGVGEVQYISALNTYQVFLTVYSNSSVDGEIDFLVWNASECIQLSGIEESYSFVANTLVGSPNQPASFTAKALIAQETSLKKGWNWISLNAFTDNMSPNQVLNSVVSANGDIIRSQSSFSQFSAPLSKWMGTLREMETGKMYQLKTSKDAPMILSGSPVDLVRDTIQISEGWNWLGYTPTFTLTVDEALDSYQPLNGDVLKSQNQFSVYVAGAGWIGNLAAMRPLKGYLLYSNANSLLVYPDAPSGQVVAKGKSNAIADGPALEEAQDAPPFPEWEVSPNDFEFTMSIIVTLETFDNLSALDSVYIGSFVNEEIRGVERLEYYEELDAYLAFLTVYSNNSSGETIKFRVYDADSETMYNSILELPFIPNEVYGSVEKPYSLNRVATSNEREGFGLPEEYSLKQNYPNPFNNGTVIQYALPEAATVTIEIYNMLGQKVHTLMNNQQMQAGFHRVNFNLETSAMATGIYIYRIQANNFTATRKMLYMK